MSADSEIEALDRILTRLGLTDDDGLESVLSKLLPLMIRKLDTSRFENKREGMKVQQKVVDILSHANKRLQGATGLKLPLSQLVELYRSASNAMVQNFSLIYIEKAMDRADLEDRRSSVGPLLKGVSGKASGQQAVLLRLVCQALAEGDSSGGSRGGSQKLYGSIEGMEQACDILAEKEDERIFLRHAMKMMMYLPASMMQSQAGEARMVPGLSRRDVDTIETKGMPKALEDTLRGVLEFVASAGLEPSSVFLLYLCASCSPYESVAKRGGELYRKTCVIDSSRPTVDVEDPTLNLAMFDLFLGTMDNDGFDILDRKLPASQSIRSKLLTVFCKSMYAANCNPQTMMVIMDCLFGESVTVSMQQQGMEFAVFVLRHADLEFLKKIAPTIIERGLQILEIPAESSGSMMLLRSFVYQCIGQLAQRSPSSLEGRLDLAKVCFEGLRSEPPGVRASVQEATSCLAGCFGNSITGLGDDIFKLIDDSAQSEQESVRLAALHWAITLFDFDDCRARYVCIRACADSRIPVAELALQGLDLDKVLALQGKGIQQGTKNEYPSFCSMLEYLSSRIKEMKKPLKDQNALVMAPQSCESAIKFLRLCEQQDSIMSPQCSSLYLGFLCSCLAKNAPSSLHELSTDALLYEGVFHRDAFILHFKTCFKVFLSLLDHVSIVVSDNAARILSEVSVDLSEDNLHQLLEAVKTPVQDCLRGKPGRLEHILGSISCLGYLCARKSESFLKSEDLETLLLECVSAKESLTEEVRSLALLSLSIACFGSTKIQDDVIHDILTDHVQPLVKSKSKDVRLNTMKSLQATSLNFRGQETLVQISDIALSLNQEKDETVLNEIGNILVQVWGTGKKRRNSWLMKYSSEDEQPISSEPYISEVRRPIIDRILRDSIQNSRSECRAAGATWMALLLQYGSHTAELSSRIAEIQSSFCILLGDDNEKTQELAGKGVTLCYETASPENKKQLVDSLLQTLSGESAARKKRPGDVTESTQIFEPGSIGSLPGNNQGKLSTYKEICSLATDLGQPDLVYQFMALAGHQAAADASRGAAYGIASVAKIAGEAIKPHVISLVPRLYRSMYDPNPKVKDAMQHIWINLIDNERECVSSNISEILRLLVKDMTGQLWRVRESAALAAADAIQGRTWHEVKDHFQGLWVSCLRVIDDVKESVRMAGLALARSLSAFSLRLADLQTSNASDAEQAVSILIPVLINNGMASNVSEVRAISILTISKVVKASGPKVLAQNFKLLVPPLLEALSGLEDSRLNYVEQHAQNLGIDSGRLEEERVRASRSSPIGDTLDLCAKVIDAESFKDISGALCGLIKRGTGSNTRVGTGRFISAVARRLGSDISSATFTLMRALQEASYIEKSRSVQRSYASAYAELAKYASKAKVDTAVDSWLQAYKNEDADDQKSIVSGTILRAIAIESPDLFLRYANEVAPVAYLASKDRNESVSMIWKDIWDESTTAVGSGIRYYVSEILEIVLKLLKSSQWAKKEIAGQVMIQISDVAGDLLGPHLVIIVKSLLDELPGRLWEGKDVMLRALGKVVECTLEEDFDSMKVPMKDDLVNSLVTAASKTKRSYMKEGVQQLGTVAKSWNMDLYPKVWPVLMPLLSEEKGFGKKEDKEASLSSRSNRAFIFDCIASNWVTTHSAVLGRLPSAALETIQCILPILDGTSDYMEQQSALTALDRIVRTIHMMPSNIEEGTTMIKLTDSLVSILTRSKVEDIRLNAIKLLSVMSDYRLIPDEAYQNMQSAITELMQTEKSFAVKSIGDSFQ